MMLIARKLSGVCPVCGGSARHYDQSAELVTCIKCGRAWPSSYWQEQVDD